MPRTNLSKQPHEDLAVLLNGYVHKDGGTAKEASQRLRMDYQKLCRRLQSPGSFTVDELIRFCRQYHVEIDKLRAAIRL